MDVWLFVAGLLLTVAPVFELRGGLPMVLFSIGDCGVGLLLLSFLLVLVLSFLLVLVLFFFLDRVHHRLVGWKFYRRNFERCLRRVQRRVDKAERKEGWALFLSLFLLVAVPLPLTGVYTGVLVSWVLGLDRGKSLLAIFLGVVVAGLIVMGVSVGALGLV